MWKCLQHALCFRDKMDTPAAGESAAANLYEQEEETRCYCEKDRNPADIEFQCTMCSRFYHADCLTCEPGPCMPFMTSYQFFCKRCNASGQDNFTKRQASFSQMCHTSVANLLHQNPDKKYFSKDKIITFIEKWWDNLTTAPRRIKQTWHTTIGKTMMKDAEIFTVDDVNATDPQFGLVMDDLLKIGPNCDALFKLIGGFYTSNNFKASNKSSSSENKGRGAKRKAPTETSSSVGRPRNRGDVNLSAKITPTCYPAEHPYNKDGYRYILAEPDPHAPNWEAFDQSMEWAGKPIPGYLYRRWLEPKVLLSLNDRAPQLKVTDDRLGVTGEKGYSMIRATHGVNYGCWYYEVTIQEMPDGTASRIGWSQELGNLQAPCGYDKFSFSWRSRKGTAFHQSRGKHFSDGYAEGDVLGFYLYLSYPSDNAQLTPQIYKDKPLVKFKNHLYYEEKDHVTEIEKKLQLADAARMVMYKNGACQGTAFSQTQIFEGFYYPAVSLYKNASVKVNFGPVFKFPPKDQKSFRPICEAAESIAIQHAVGDVLYHIDNEGQLPEF